MHVNWNILNHELWKKLHSNDESVKTFIYDFALVKADMHL
jgi:hypothetical protein